MKSNIRQNNRPPVVILAAGLSARMGSLKPFLKWDDQTTFLEKIILDYKDFGSEEIIVVVNPQIENILKKDFPALAKEANYVINHEPEKGKLLSLKQGLKSLGDREMCFIQNVDNPFIGRSLLEGMAGLGDRTSYVVPQFNGKSGHPLLAGGDTLAAIMEQEQDDSNLRLILKPYRKVFYSAKNDEVLININSEAEYQKFILKFQKI